MPLMSEVGSAQWAGDRVCKASLQVNIYRRGNRFGSHLSCGKALFRWFRIWEASGRALKIVSTPAFEPVSDETRFKPGF
jgi:hypothetical protein